MTSARSSGRSTACALPAASVPPTTPATTATPLASLVAATAAPLHAGGAARAFAHGVDVVDVLGREQVAVRLHDRVGQALAVVGLDPGLDRLEGAAGERGDGRGAGEPGEAARERGRHRHSF